MKGCASLLVALLVLAALLVGGYWLYQRVSEEGGFSSAPPELTVQNQTQFSLTVRMTSPEEAVEIQVLPGRSQTRTMKPQTYTVEGRVAAPDTTEFSGQWTFERGQKYTAGFQRSGEGGVMAVVRPGQP